MTKSLLRHDTKQSREAAMEEVSPETTAECGQRRCGCYVLQTWATATRKALSAMIDRRVRRTTSDDDDAERRRSRALKSADWQSSSAKYDGAAPCRHLCIQGQQVWSQFAPPLAWAGAADGGAEWCGRTLVKKTRTSRAAEFITDWSHFSRYWGTPARVADKKYFKELFQQEWFHRTWFHQNGLILSLNSLLANISPSAFPGDWVHLLN